MGQRWQVSEATWAAPADTQCEVGLDRHVGRGKWLTSCDGGLARVDTWGEGMRGSEALLNGPAGRTGQGGSEIDSWAARAIT